jgi:hypothetical protein
MNGLKLSLNDFEIVFWDMIHHDMWTKLWYSFAWKLCVKSYCKYHISLYQEPRLTEGFLRTMARHLSLSCLTCDNDPADHTGFARLGESKTSIFWSDFRPLNCSIQSKLSQIIPAYRWTFSPKFTQYRLKKWYLCENSLIAKGLIIEIWTLTHNSPSCSSKRLFNLRSHDKTHRDNASPFEVQR